MSRASRDFIARGIGFGLEGGFNAYQQHQSEKKLNAAREVLRNPQATTLQVDEAISQLPKDEQAPYLMRRKSELENAQGMQLLQQFLGPQRHAAVQQAQNIPMQFQNSPLNGVMNQAGLQMQQPMQQQQQAPQEENIIQGMQSLPKDQLLAIGSTQGPVGSLANRILRDRQEQEKLQVKERLANEAADRQQNQFEKKQRLDIHKMSAPSYEKIEKQAETANTRLRSFDTMKNALASGNLNPTNFKNLLRKSLENTRWKDFILNEDQAAFQAASLDTFEGMKDIFGIRLSDADLSQASGKIPSLDKSPEANMSIINFLEFKDRLNIEKAKIANEIIEENGGYRPIDFPLQVKKRMQERYGEEAQRVTKLAAHEGEIGPKFNIANPVHKSRRDEILQSVGGNREKAEAILRQEFVP